MFKLFWYVLALYASFAKTLKEYETTLERQSKYIREAEEEKESAQAQNEELLQKIDEMERQLVRANSSKDNLDVKIHELTEALEGTSIEL